MTKGRVKIVALVEADSQEEGLALFHRHSPELPLKGQSNIIPDDNPVIYRIVATVGDDEKVLSAKRMEGKQDETP
jgi:hypothetical protein